LQAGLPYMERLSIRLWNWWVTRHLQWQKDILILYPMPKERRLKNSSVIP